MSESQQLRETQRFQILELLDADSVNSVKEIVSKMENVSKKLKTIKKKILLQGIFLTQGSILGLLHTREILCHLGYRGSPKRVTIDIKKNF